MPSFLIISEVKDFINFKTHIRNGERERGRKEGRKGEKERRKIMEKFFK
jgi:hypothetical protein